VPVARATPKVRPGQVAAWTAQNSAIPARNELSFSGSSDGSRNEGQWIPTPRSVNKYRTDREQCEPGDRLVRAKTPRQPDQYRKYRVELHLEAETPIGQQRI